ncbi:Hypothetical_protein [Hexamita inflata]|uniref:Hypothetical_protein n=1 Tax=Hexamita inflata TaxID=28002 RepID=A0ABP1GGJ3_9EUKA
MSDVKVVSTVSTQQNNMQYDIYDSLKIPKVLEPGEKSTVTIADTECLHKINKQIQLEQKQLHEAISSNIDQINRSLDSTKQLIETKRNKLGELVALVDDLYQKQDVQMKQIDDRILKLTNYFIKYNLQ